MCGCVCESTVCTCLHVSFELEEGRLQMIYNYSRIQTQLCAKLAGFRDDPMRMQKLLMKLTFT